MSRPVRNKSIFWSVEHAKLLWHLAEQVHRYLPWAEIDDLMTIGWYKQVRYYDNLHGRSQDIIRGMLQETNKLRPVWLEIKELIR